MSCVEEKEAKRVSIIETEAQDRNKEAQIPEEIRPTFWWNLSTYFSEFTSASSLHGVQYTGDRNRTIFERTLWIFIISASLMVCLFNIHTMYSKWMSTPIVVTFSNAPIPIAKVPFPAVTICPNMEMSQWYRRRIPDNTIRSFMECSPLHCDNLGNYSDDTTLDILLNLAPSHLLWKICKGPLCSFGSWVFTNMGICHSHNILNADNLYSKKMEHRRAILWNAPESNWSSEHDYNTMPKYPYHVPLADFNRPASITFRQLPKLGNCTIEYFKVFFHHPGEIPDDSMEYLTVYFGTKVQLAITPEVIKTSSDLKKYDPKTRRCYFSGEKMLFFYKHYTERNCNLECFSNRTLERCGCVEFYMPRQKTTPICKNETTIYCAWESSYRDAKCDCLPSCNKLEYSTSPLIYTNVFGVGLSTLDMYYKSSEFFEKERKESYGLTDFISDCGGLLGLFIGFSLLSFIEVFYFLTIRLTVNAWKYGRHYWAAPRTFKDTDK